MNCSAVNESNLYDIFFSLIITLISKEIKNIVGINNNKLIN